MMTIQFNGTPIQTEANTLLEVLLEQGFEANSHVATAVNGKFVAKATRECQPISDGDQVEVVAPMQGG